MKRERATQNEMSEMADFAERIVRIDMEGSKPADEILQEIKILFPEHRVIAEWLLSEEDHVSETRFSKFMQHHPNIDSKLILRNSRKRRVFFWVLSKEKPYQNPPLKEQYLPLALRK